MAKDANQSSMYNWTDFIWNASHNGYEAYESFMALPGVKGTFITLYAMTVVVSLIGNGLVIYSVIHEKTLQTIRNFFIVNLSVTNILMSLLGSSLTPLTFYLKSWFLGEFLCTLFPICLGTFVHVSTFTCAAIAFHRYLQIVRPSRNQMTTRTCLLILLFIWIASIGIGTPTGVFSEVWEFEDYSYCVEVWPSLDDRKVYTVVDIMIQFVIPCSFMTYFYVAIWRSMHLYGGTVATYAQMEENEPQVRQTNVMLVLMVVVFLVCWLPITILFLLFEFQPNILVSSAVDILYFITHLLAMTSTVWYPFLYAGMDKALRKEFKKTLSRMLTKIGLTSGPTTQYSSEPDVQENDVIHYVPQGDTVDITAEQQTTGKKP